MHSSVLTNSHKKHKKSQIQTNIKKNQIGHNYIPENTITDLYCYTRI